MRQPEGLKTEINVSHHVTITHHITPENLQAMHNHYAAILKTIETAQDLETQRKLNQLRINREIDITKQDYASSCISLARIKRKRQLSIAMGKIITGMNHTMTRDKAAKGRKLSLQRKKLAAFNLWQSGIKQNRICKMLGYKAAYVSKMIKREKAKLQPPLF